MAFESTYEQFDVVEWVNGLKVPRADVEVKAWDATSDVDLGVTLTTDSEGIIASGTLSVPAETVIWFRVENYNGLAGVLEKITFTP